MLLTDQQVQNAKIVREGNPRYFSSGCYLTIGAIIDLETRKEVTEYTIPPQGMVYAISAEALVLPENITGYTTVKNSLSNQALLCLNIGIVDAMFDRPIGSVMINFGNAHQHIKLGDEFLRMTFHKSGNADILPLNLTNGTPSERKKTYIESTIQKLGYLGSRFLSFDKVEEKIAKETEKKIKDDIDRSLRLSFTIISAFGVLIALLVNFDKISDTIKGEKNISPQIITAATNNQLADTVKTSNRLTNVEKRLQQLEIKVKSLRP